MRWNFNFFFHSFFFWILTSMIEAIQRVQILIMHAHVVIGQSIRINVSPQSKHWNVLYMKFTMWIWHERKKIEKLRGENRTTKRPNTFQPRNNYLIWTMNLFRNDFCRRHGSNDRERGRWSTFILVQMRARERESGRNRTNNQRQA